MPSALLFICSFTIFVKFIFTFFRFLVLPASLRAPTRSVAHILRSPYCVTPDLLLDHPDEDRLDFRPSFRQELSDAFCLVNFLEQDSVVRSFLEKRPLSDYFDQASYDVCGLLYPPNITPIDDLDRCSRLNSLAWYDHYRTSRLIP